MTKRRFWSAAWVALEWTCEHLDHRICGNFPFGQRLFTFIGDRSDSD